MRSDDFARATVHDLSSVIRDEIAAIFPKIQLLCEWLQCRHSTTGSEYDTDPQFFLDIEECIAVLFRQLILVLSRVLNTSMTMILYFIAVKFVKEN